MMAEKKGKARKVPPVQIGLLARTLEDAKDLAPRTSVIGPCEEASTLSRERYLPCATPGAALVWHEKDRRLYRMCLPCTDHNVRHRGGVLLKGGEALRAAVKTGPVLAIPATEVLEIKALRRDR